MHQNGGGAQTAWQERKRAWIAKEQDSIALEALKKEVATKLSKGNNISQDVPKAKAAAKEAKSKQQALLKQLEDV